MSRALDLRVTKKKLDGSQIAGAAIDQCRLCSTKRMGPVVVRIQAHAADPLGNEAGVLSCRYIALSAAAPREQKSPGFLPAAVK